MNSVLFEDYGEAIIYVLLAVMALGFMTAAMGAFTAF